MFSVEFKFRPGDKVASVYDLTNVYVISQCIVNEHGDHLYKFNNCHGIQYLFENELILVEE